MTKILVTGANGQLGSDIRKLSKNYNNFEFIFTDVEDLDITNIQNTDSFFNKNKPEYIVNCAAYTAVDNAETDKENAEKVNVNAVGILAEMSVKYNCKIIHFSTDYVYDGISKAIPYIEKDNTNPTSVYGKTKLHGEQTLVNLPYHIIIRTSWLYSSFGNNFVKTMLRLGKERNELKVIFDQIGTPTFGQDLAQATLTIIEKSEADISNFKSGIYHYSNEGVCSWYDFATEIMDLSNIKCKIIPIESSEFPQKANRPHFSVLNKKKIKTTFNISIPHWKESLKVCLGQIENI